MMMPYMIEPLCLIGGIHTKRLFLDERLFLGSRRAMKMAPSRVEWFLPARPDETCSWDRDRAARTRRDDTVRRIRRSRMSCARRIPFACAFRSPPDSGM